MDPLFNEVGIYSATGQRYEPVDSELVLKYREAIDGQVLEEGITEAGSAAGFQAAGHLLRHARLPGDPVLHLLLDVRLPADRRPVLGRRRRAGARLPHGRDRRPHDAHRRGPPARRRPQPRARHDQPGRPRSYDPTFAYELAAIIRDGIERMHVKGEDLIYYISLYNENYAQAPKPEGVDEGILRGIYRVRRRARSCRRRAPRGPARRLGLDPAAGHRRAGAARRAVRRRRRGLLRAVVPDAPPRRARGRPLEPPPSRPSRPRIAVRRRPSSAPKGGPIVAASDWMKALPDLVAAVGRCAVRHARHRRLRPQRHARCAARLLRDRRRRASPPRRCRRSRGRRDHAGGRRRGHREARHRPGQGRPARRLAAGAAGGLPT